MGTRNSLGVRDNATLRLTYAPSLFFSYTAVTGAAELYAPGWVMSPTNYAITPLGNQNSAIKSVAWNEYVYLYAATQSPYIDRSGNPSNSNAQWYLEPKQNVLSGNQCCWNRQTQGCSKDGDCDPGGEGCIASGSSTLTYGTFQCNTCEMQGEVYDPATASCKPK